MSHGSRAGVADAQRPAVDAELVQVPRRRRPRAAVEERHDVTLAAAIREAIERAMASGMRGVRARAAAIGEAVRAAVAEGGSLRQDMDDLVAYLTR